MSDPIKKSVQIDLEVDTTTTDSSKNPYQGLIHMAKAVDASSIHWLFVQQEEVIQSILR